MQQQADAAAAAHEKTVAEARAKAQALAQSAARRRWPPRPTRGARRWTDELGAKLAAAEAQIAATLRRRR